MDCSSTPMHGSASEVDICKVVGYHDSTLLDIQHICILVCNTRVRAEDLGLHGRLRQVWKRT